MSERGLEDSHGGNSTRWWKRSAFPVVLAAALGAIGGGPGWNTLVPPRENPWTSHDAKDVENQMRRDFNQMIVEVKREINELSREMETYEEKMAGRLDRMDARQNLTANQVANLPPDDLLERVTRAEERIQYIERGVAWWLQPIQPQQQ